MLTKCCCCCNLVTGGKVLGWLEVIAGVLTMLNAIIFREMKTTSLTNSYGGSSSHSYDDLYNNPYGSNNLKVVTVQMPLHMSILMGLQGLSYIIVGGILLFGIYKEKAQMVYNWIIISSVRLVIGIIYSCYIMIATLKQAYLIIPVLLFTALEIYFIICIFSLYKKMLSPEGVHGGAVLSRPGQPQYANPPTVVYGLPTAPQCGQPMQMQGDKPQYNPQGYNQA